MCKPVLWPTSALGCLWYIQCSILRCEVWPQEAQYIPGPWLKEGKNELIFLEVEKSPAAATGLSSRPIGAQTHAKAPS